MYTGVYCNCNQTFIKRWFSASEAVPT